MKYKDCTIKREMERSITWSRYGSYREHIKHYVVNGPGFRNRKFDNLREAKMAINIIQRKIDSDFAYMKRDISTDKKLIKVLQASINKKEKYMRGE